MDKIGANIAGLIEDGATLQMGQGKIPNAILKCLFDKKDLGIHTEVFSDNLLPLIEAGVINGARKSINKGKIISTFIQGTRKLYDFADGNDMIQLHPVDYTNHVGVISQNDNMVAINSAIEVDLTGQVAADSMGMTLFSGIGGQLDFIRGAALAKNGKPIIALPATAKKGTVSRIVARMQAGTPIATPRNDIFYVVTEYGVAELFGKCLRDRAKALIQIAAPQFREDLERDFYGLYQKSGI
ncbi:Butanoate coenzyme A-transferase [bioreactor metagenome]|uniref:Butanoate coenzyme A-transferase n=1 Tax=bioreactor metagenome TaxID=1076179 RepID=A0A645EM02_9ZZZZ